MELKYKLGELESNGLRRVIALRDFGGIKAGNIGGYVENEKNLSHEGNCWVYGNAEVSDDARVYGNAQVYGNAWVSICLFIQQIRHGITATDTHVAIGCENLTWEEWEGQIQAIGTVNNYTQEEIRQVNCLLSIFKFQLTGKAWEGVVL